MKSYKRVTFELALVTSAAPVATPATAAPLDATPAP